MSFFAGKDVSCCFHAKGGLVAMTVKALKVAQRIATPHWSSGQAIPIPIADPLSSYEGGPGPSGENLIFNLLRAHPDRPSLRVGASFGPILCP